MKNILIALTTIAATVSMVSKPSLAAPTGVTVVNWDYETCINRGGEYKGQNSKGVDVCWLRVVKNQVKASKTTNDCETKPSRGCGRRDK